jgi:two-component system, chemotaxis family, response regulator Rcp1
MTASLATVLVVDDNQGFLRAARGILGDAFVVHTVENGTDALAFLERRGAYGDAPRPAFVVLDFHLPDMNAPTILARLAGDDGLRAIPVLVMSQADWEEDEAAARAAGARAFQVKPSRLQALRDAIMGFWKEHGGHGGHDPADRR